MLSVVLSGPGSSLSLATDAFVVECSVRRSDVTDNCGIPGGCEEVLVCDPVCINRVVVGLVSDPQTLSEVEVKGATCFHDIVVLAT